MINELKEANAIIKAAGEIKEAKEKGLMDYWNGLGEDWQNAIIGGGLGMGAGALGGMMTGKNPFIAGGLGALGGGSLGYGSGDLARPYFDKLYNKGMNYFSQK